ncbi:MAG TPA: hypothetical protein VI138_03250, partial [Candidatus Dormibacteraeota bacterium]
TQDKGLRRNLRAAASEMPPADADIARIAALLSELGRGGARERRLAIAVLEQVVGYAEGRRSPAR